MAIYHNEKTTSEIAICFEKIAASGICTAEQLRKTAYYEESIEAIYNFVRDVALKTKKSKDMLKASGLEADDVAVGFVLECMEKDGKLNGLLRCRDEGYFKYTRCCLVNYLTDLGKHGTRKTKDSDAEREKIVATADDQTLELLSAEMEAAPVGCELIEFILGNVELSPVEKLMALSLDNKWHEVAAAYRNVHGVEKFVHMLTYETKERFYGTELFSGAEKHAAICTLKRAADPEKTLLLARYRARKKLVKEFGSQEELCRRLKKS